MVRISKAVHRQLAAECFNATWALIEKRERSPADARMIHMAHTSRHQWGVAGGPIQAATGE